MQNVNFREAETNHVSNEVNRMSGYGHSVADATRVQEIEPCPAGTSTVALNVHNTACAVQLFIRAAFAGLPPSFRRDDTSDPLTPALFSLGGIDAAVDLGHLSQWTRGRIERLFLQERFGIGYVASWRLQRELRKRINSPFGQEALSVGRQALVEWLHGDDPSWRLRQLIRSDGERPTPPRHPASQRRSFQMQGNQA